MTIEPVIATMIACLIAAACAIWMWHDEDK